MQAGAAATHAEALKQRKYHALAQRFVFEPTVVETSGAVGEDTIYFVSTLETKISAVTGDSREISFQRQRI